MQNENFDPQENDFEPKEKNGTSSLIRSFWFLLFLLVITIIISIYRQNRENLVPETQIVTETIIPSPSPINPTATPTAVLPMATVEPTPTTPPTAAPLSENLSEGLMILSIVEDGFSHLFAFQPQTMGYTRLSGGEVNDIEPAISPDGTKIAFSSDLQGHYDIYILDLLSDEITAITNDLPYDGHPTWSPDGLWISYERFQNNNLDIVIQPIDLSFQPVQVTFDLAADFSPDWGPDGKTIAFTSSRYGALNIWTVDIENIGVEGSLVQVTSSEEDQENAQWSPNGDQIAWTAPINGVQSIFIGNPDPQNGPPKYLGVGSEIAWNPTGEIILAGIHTPLKDLIAAYPIDAQALLLPPQSLPGRLEGLAWGENAYPSPPNTDQTLFEDTTSSSNLANEGNFGRQNTVSIADLVAPYPEFNALAVDAFEGLRAETLNKTGWDVLGDLDNAFVPLTVKLPPGRSQDWLYTGRAFEINHNLCFWDWVMLVREDFGNETYWRIFLRPLKQDGNQGKPLTEFPWDIDGRKSDGNGGLKYDYIPGGYWVDFTALAQDSGWQRQPALENWQQYYPGIQFNLFAYTANLSWEDAMRQLYPEEIFQSGEGGILP